MQFIPAPREFSENADLVEYAGTPAGMTGRTGAASILIALDR
jgi:hypothetical protein